MFVFTVNILILVYIKIKKSINPGSTPQGLEDVSSYPLLFAELMEEGWSIEELRKLAGLNLLRVLGAAERVSKELSAAHVSPYEEMPPRSLDVHNCSSQDL